MSDSDKSKQLALQVCDAINDKRKLNITAGNSKAFYGGNIIGEPVSVSEHSGIINYQPGELVITARAGTPLQEVEAILAEKKQRLLFEPPHFASTATLGGTIAADISGPVRPWSGSVKDALLGINMINGHGETLKFGGEVMKNVAGYDVSRLMVGSMGTLGILLDVSLKVLPAERKTITLVFDASEESAIQQCNKINRQYLPVSGMMHYQGKLYIRLSGNTASVESAKTALGGEESDNNPIWQEVREQTHAFFEQKGTLWRLSVAPATPPIKTIPGSWLIDWGGAQRWLISDSDASHIRSETSKLGGHATIFRGSSETRDMAFHPLNKIQKELHQRIKQAMDPHLLFNPGRLYSDL